jgi:hypothetical protein
MADALLAPCLWAVAQIIRAVSDVFGRGIWKKTVLVLTHGNLTQTPPGTDYGT